jgi:pantothenate kinase
VTPSVSALAAEIIARAEGVARLIVAVAGPPGAGKSTLAEALTAAISDARPGLAALVPMDGFHLDNAVLQARGILSRKGAPESFDVAGLRCAMQRIAAGDGPVAVPVFDRELDLARAGARIIAPSQRVVVVEGNYLLLRDPPWDTLCDMYDVTISVEVGEPELRRRLLDRWLGYGLAADEARARAEGNDLINAKLVLERSRPADIVCREAAAAPDGQDPAG